MKTGFWDRLLIYLYVLISLIITAAMLMRAFGIDLMNIFIQGLNANMPGLFWRLIIIGLFTMIGVLGISVAVLVTPRRKKNKFVTLCSDEGGEVLVSLPAIREMAGQAIRSTKGLEAVVINVTESSDSICVNVNMDVECGVHVPTVTMNMKRAIKTNIERNCGINVRSVTVEVRNVLPSADASHIEEVEIVPVVMPDIPVQPVIESVVESNDITATSDDIETCDNELISDADVMPDAEEISDAADVETEYDDTDEAKAEVESDSEEAEDVSNVTVEETCTEA